MDWSFGDVLWAMVAFFFWFLFVWMFISVFADILQRRDLSGGAKAAWVFLLVVLPFLGILIYMIARPSVIERDRQMMREEPQRGMSGYSVADEIEKLSRLHEQGKISDEEYERLKQRALA